MTNKTNQPSSYDIDLLEAMINTDRFSIVRILKRSFDHFGIKKSEMSELLTLANLGKLDSVLSILNKGRYLDINKEEEFGISAVNRVIKVSALLYTAIEKSNPGDAKLNTIKAINGDSVTTFGEHIFHDIVRKCQNNMSDSLADVGRQLNLNELNMINMSSHYPPEIRAFISDHLLSKVTEQSSVLTNQYTNQAVRRARI